MFKRLVVITGFLIANAACGQSSTPTTPSPVTMNGMTVSIVSGAKDLTSTAYNPNPITVSTGTTVTWMNNDSITHTSTSSTGTWDSGTMAPGASFSHTFASAGTFTYHCAIHPNMVGTVTVQ